MTMRDDHYEEQTEWKKETLATLHSVSKWDLSEEEQQAIKTVIGIIQDV